MVVSPMQRMPNSETRVMRQSAVRMVNSPADRDAMEVDRSCSIRSWFPGLWALFHVKQGE